MDMVFFLPVFWDEATYIFWVSGPFKKEILYFREIDQFPL